MSEVKKKSTISLEIGLDETSVPTVIRWKSDDKPENEFTEAKAFLLSIFDKEYKDTLKIDLWTKEFQIDEMDRMMYYTLKGLADSYFKATKNQSLANEMQQFIQHFGERTKILK